MRVRLESRVGFRPSRALAAARDRELLARALLGLGLLLGLGWLCA
jgi:hypothetical protein